MSEIEQSSGFTFLLGELRDLRKGMENRDETLRGSLTSLSKDVNTLASAIQRSESNEEIIRADVDKISAEIKDVKHDVSELVAERSKEKIQKESSWYGPRKVVRNIIFIGAGLAATTSIYTFWPVLVAIISVIGD